MAVNQLLNNRVGKPKKSDKRGCLFLLVGSLFALLATGGFVLVVSLLSGVVIESRHGGETAYALMTIVKPCYGIAMLCFYGILAVWYVSPPAGKTEPPKKGTTMAPLLGRHNQEKAPEALPRRTLWLISAGLFCGVLITGAVAVNTYRLVSTEGIRSYCFVETASYEWKQVTTYRVGCDTDGGLSMTFTMRDGKQYEILQGVNAATTEFKEDYTSVTHFSADIDERMVALQVPRNVQHMERAVKFYREDYPELWPYVSRIIGYADLMPEDDETAPETEDITAALTE